MRRILLLLLVAIVTLVAAAPAPAAERRIAADNAYELSTYRGWLLWRVQGGGVVLWRGSSRAFDPPGSRASGVQRARLGSDARGRTSIAYTRCATATAESYRWRDCEVVRHLLATGAERTMLRADDSFDLGAPELDGGALAISLRKPDQGSERPLRLFRPGLRERLLSADQADPDMDRGRLAYTAARESGFQNAFWVARAIDLRPRLPRYRTLATYDGRDDDGRIPGTTVTSFDGAASDGRYAYWLRANLRDTLATSTFEVWRADLDDPRATVTKVTLEHPALSIAVTKGRIYYTGRYGVDPGVFEVRDPAWIDTGLTTPVTY